MLNNLPKCKIHSQTSQTNSHNKLFHFLFPGGCFRCSEPASAAWTRTPCTRCCWILWPQTTTGGNTSTGSGFPEANRSHRAPAASTSTRTPPTSERTGWKRRFPSAKSNSPINSTEADRWGIRNVDNFSETFYIISSALEFRPEGSQKEKNPQF